MTAHKCCLVNLILSSCMRNCNGSRHPSAKGQEFEPRGLRGTTIGRTVRTHTHTHKRKKDVTHTLMNTGTSTQISTQTNK